MRRPSSEETRRKISEKLKGRKGPTISEEAKRRISIANKGRIKSEEERRKISERQKGHTLGEESRRKISIANKGRIKSEEERRKISLAHKGHFHSEEAKRKMSEIKQGEKHPLYGRSPSMDTRKKMSCSLRGIPESDFKGFTAYLGYCEKWTREFRERVRDYYKRIGKYHCHICGMTEQENGKQLTVHHVHYKKEACCDDDIKRYFVLCCTTCHGKTNSNRSYWIKKFEQFIEEQCGGKCYLHRWEKQ